MTILEAFRVLLTDPRIASGKAENTIEFHWYAGEEFGLLGSGAIFQHYHNQDRDVIAMLNQDMTGYVKPDTQEVIGIITDNVDPDLTAFLKMVVKAVSLESRSLTLLIPLYLTLWSSTLPFLLWRQCAVTVARITNLPLEWVILPPSRTSPPAMIVALTSILLQTPWTRSTSITCWNFRRL